MQATSFKQVRHLIAYVAGGALVFVGIMGLLNEFSTGKPSSTNFYGYGLAVLLTASGVLTCFAARSQVKSVGASVASGVLVFLGILGLLLEFKKIEPSSTNFFGYVLAVVLIASGALTWLAARLHYGGGLWSFCGLLCVAAAFTRFASALQAKMRGRHLISPEFFYSTTTVLLGVGCYCLIWGHMRHHRQKKNASKDTT